MDDEIQFLHRYYRLLLMDCGVRDRLEERAAEFHRATWLKGITVYPEVREVLDFFKTRGFQMGVISDTSPSLELTLQAAGIARYFSSFTASSLVGAEKPSPDHLQRRPGRAERYRGAKACMWTITAWKRTAPGNRGLHPS